MEIWAEGRRRVLTGELSKRAACKEYGLNWRTLEKMLSHVEQTGYRRQEKREQPVLGPHLAWIHEVLEQDKKEPRKQRHTAKRIFDRLRAERSYSGGYTVVKVAVQKWKATTKEVFIPLSHPPGEAQVDFGFAYVDVAGDRQQVALFVMSLPYSDALSIQAFPRECTEAFLDLAYLQRLQWRGQDPSGDRPGSRRLRTGPEGAVLPSDRTDHAAHGGQGGEAAPAAPQADQAARPHRS